MPGTDSDIIGWLKHSFIDYPGMVSTVLFFSGCNLRCPYCHNPSIVKNRLPSVPFAKIKDYLALRRSVIDGVVISGGEPTIHQSMLTVAASLRNEKFSIKLDTNGLNPQMIEKCNPDYLAVDIKTSFSRYCELSCVLNDCRERLTETLEIVRKMGEQAEVRITVAPLLIDDSVIIELADVLKGVAKIYLQPFNQTSELLDPSYKELEPVSPEKISKYRDYIKQITGACRIRGE
jgi:pyruvate formate lyase activating enzyme